MLSKLLLLRSVLTSTQIFLVLSLVETRQIRAILSKQPHQTPLRRKSAKKVWANRTSRRTCDKRDGLAPRVSYDTLSHAYRAIKTIAETGARVGQPRIPGKEVCWLTLSSGMQLENGRLKPRQRRLWPELLSTAGALRQEKNTSTGAKGLALVTRHSSHRGFLDVLADNEPG